jgi:hypothetical protein
MHRPLLHVLPLALLASLALASDAHAGKPKAKAKDQPARLHALLELELHDVEAGTTRALLVPEHGELRGWVELFGSARPCRAQSHPTHDETLVVELSCHSEQHGDALFELRSELVLARGEPTVLGELELREGERLRVTATRR